MFLIVFNFQFFIYFQRTTFSPIDLFYPIALEGTFASGADFGVGAGERAPIS